MHNVLAPNIAKRAGKRVPSPQKINYNNHNQSPHTLFLGNQSNIACVNKEEEEGTRFFMEAALQSRLTWKNNESSISIR